MSSAYFSSTFIEFRVYYDIVIVVILRVVIVVVADVGRSFEDEKKAKMGIVECVKHSLIEPFSVLYEREGICCSWLLTISLLPF